MQDNTHIFNISSEYIRAGVYIIKLTVYINS
jgi:hypothetical protein